MSADSLRVHLVQRSIDAHGGTQTCHAFVFLQPQQDTSQSGGDQVSRAKGDDSADLQRHRLVEGQFSVGFLLRSSAFTRSLCHTHVLNGDAVLSGGLHPEPDQNLLAPHQPLLAPTQGGREQMVSESWKSHLTPFELVAKNPKK